MSIPTCTSTVLRAVRCSLRQVLAITMPTCLIGENPESVGREWTGMVLTRSNIWGRVLTMDEIAFLQTKAGTVPEPSSLMLAALGLLGLLGQRRRK